MLLIGDKVVEMPRPARRSIRFKLDLWEEWKKLTDLPFVFAMWMMRKDVLDAGSQVGALRVCRACLRGGTTGAGRLELTEGLLDRYAEEKGWPRELAQRYFTQYLRYEVTPRAREGLARFFEIADRLGLLKWRRAIEYLEIPGHA